MLDLLRVLVGAAVLLYAVHTDLRTRRVPNRTWLLPIGAGLAMDVPDALEGGALFLRGAALSAGVMVPLALAIYYFPGSGFGGADAKALIALSVLFPAWPALGALPVSQSSAFALGAFTAPSGVFTLGLLYNALFLSLLIPLGFLLWNLKRGARSRFMWVGYPVPVSRLDPTRMKLLHPIPGDPERAGALGAFRGRKVTEPMVRDLEARLGAGGEVWVTPLLPFMVSLAFGFVVALVFGNVLLWVATLGRLPA
ncbi:MAG: prepilin peptidase [Halobacteria archaeon]